MEKHILIAAATSEYANLGPEAQRPELKQVLESVVQLFTGTLKSYRRDLTDLGENGENPKKADLEQKLDEWFGNKDRDPSDWVVLYYTGHAKVVAPDSLYLLTRETKPASLPSTSFNLQELASYVLAEGDSQRPRRVRNLLIIVDTCFAGKGTLELAEQFRKVLWRLSGGAIYLLGAAMPTEEAKAGALAEALIQAVKELSERNVTQPYLLLEELVPQINDRLGIHRAICTPVFLERQKFFPNSSYVDTGGKSVPANEAQRAIVSQEFREHWGPRSRGVEFDTQAGSYFSGRDKALDDLKGFFANEADNRTRVVTGQPGAGKSAILSRVVSGSLPPESRPAATHTIGPVDVAIHAKGKTLTEVTSRLAQAFAVEAKPETILETLAHAPKRAHIVLDALDEASEPSAIANQLLRPMGAMDSVKLVVGTRKSFARSLGEAEVIDIDRPRYAKKEDIASYVRARLLGSGERDGKTPYTGKNTLAGEVAEAVAESAHPNFLVARLMTEDLLNRHEEIDSESLAQMKLPRKVSGAFEAYLARFGDKERMVRDLLLPLAYAEGAGLPWDNIWAPVASTLAKHGYNDEDVRWLLQNAGAFVLEAAEEGRTVYRLFHRALAETLRSGKDLQRSQRAIVRALIGSVPSLPGDKGVEWLLANRYVRAHLATHAAAARQLDQLVIQPMFLAAAQPASLLRAFSSVSTPEARQARLVYRIAAHHWTPQVSLGDWVSYLELTAKQNGTESIANGLAEVPVPRRWSTTWAYFDKTIPHRILPGHQGPVRAAAVWNDTVLSASDDGTIRRWDLDTGALLGDPLQGHEGPIYSLSAGKAGKRGVIVSGGEDGTVRMWPLAEGAESPMTMRGHRGAVSAVVLAKVGKITTILSGGIDGTIRFWSASGEPLGEPLRAHGRVEALAFCEVNGLGQLITAGDGAVIRVWNAETLELIRELKARDRSQGHFNVVNALACIEVDGKAVVVSGGHDGRVQRWDLATGEPMGLPIQTSHLFVLAVCGSMLRNQAVLATAGADAKVGIWKADTQEPIGKPLTGHDKTVLALAARHTATNSRVISGGVDCTVRIWDLDALLDDDADTRAGQVSEVWSVAVSGSTAAARSYDRHVRLFDAATGKLTLEIATGSDAFRRGLAICETAGEILLALNGHTEVHVYRIREGSATECVLPAILGGADTLFFHSREGRVLLTGIGGNGEMITWDVATQSERTRTRLDLHRGWRDLPEQWTDTIAAGVRTDGRPLVVSGGSGVGAIRIWNPEDGQLEKEIPVSSQHDEKVWSNALTIGTVDGHVVVVSGNSDGYIRIWDGDDGAMLGERQTTGAVHAVQVGFLGEHPVVAWGGDDHVLGIWWPGSAIHEAIDVGCPVHAIAFMGHDTLLAGTARGLVAVRLAI